MKPRPDGETSLKRGFLDASFIKASSALPVGRASVIDGSMIRIRGFLAAARTQASWALPEVNGVASSVGGVAGKLAASASEF